MAFWSKNSSSPSETTAENPFRSIDPAAFDKGAKINDVSGQLRRLASTELEGSDVVAALQAALGAEIAALTARRNPNAGPDTLRYITDQLLDAVREGLREATYIGSEPTSPAALRRKRPYRARVSRTDKSDHERGNAWQRTRDRSMTATAKVLGTILCTVGQRPGVDVDRLIAFGQEAIGQYAKEAIALHQQDR